VVVVPRPFPISLSCPSRHHVIVLLLSHNAENALKDRAKLGDIRCGRVIVQTVIEAGCPNIDHGDHSGCRNIIFFSELFLVLIQKISPQVHIMELPAHKVYNIGNSNPEKLMKFIGALEKALSNALGREVEFEKIYEPMKPGDVPATYASTDRLYDAVGFKPKTSIEDGLQKFADWYVKYYNVK
jgi:nucleoside-diphosphate-sugar epimerase